VLRLIALDRLVHFLVLGILAVAVFLFTAHQEALKGMFFQILDVVQGGGGPNGCNDGNNGKGLLGWLEQAVCAKSSTLWFWGGLLAGYAVLEGIEAVGLWLTKRWAEYLTFVATTVLLVPEVHELMIRITPLKVIALIINLLVVGYLLFAKRLFGLRGGGRVEAAERARDTGWPALERVLPGG
jgi:uncharacterized membrane protein (DUF2068 family)